MEELTLNTDALFTDINRLKTLNKQDAIYIIMHLIDAARLLITTEPELALVLTNIATIVKTETNLTETEIEETEQLISNSKINTEDQ